MWPYGYIILLSAINKITACFGSPLHLLVSTRALLVLWVIVYAAAWLFVILLLFTKVTRTRKGSIYTLIIWTLICTLLDITEGAMREGIERAAGKPPISRRELLLRLPH